MMKLRHVFYLFISSVLSVILSGCKLAILDPKGVIATAEKNLLIDATLLMLIVVIPVIILTFVFAWKYRASNMKARYEPNWSHNSKLEIVWWSIPCVIIGILAVITWFSTHKLDPYRPLNSSLKPITIEAIALDWKWLFIYPEQKIATLNYLEIPTHVPIKFYITADAPMNSLEIPRLAGQIYAMTGMRTKLYLMADVPGVYRGLSTNFSGDGFSDMYFQVKATSEKSFNHWVQKVKAAPQRLNMHAYNEIVQPSRRNPVEYFSAPEPNLFNKVIMKYMGPHMASMGS